MDGMTVAGTLAERMGITITEASPHRVVGSMPVEGNTQPYGLLHGGASCVLAETLGSVGAAMHAAAKDGAIAVGIDINATHHKGMRARPGDRGRHSGAPRADHRDVRDRHHRRRRYPGLHGPADLPAAPAVGSPALSGRR